MTNDKIKNWIETLLKSIPLSYSEIKIEENEGRVNFLIESEESGFLIGNGGENLMALNHLLKRALERNYSDEKREKKSVSIDVNGYRKKNEERIKSVATMLGERALGLRHEVLMEPAGSFERRVVHAHFQDHPHLTTESRGFGRDRRVVIKYVEEKTNNQQLTTNKSEGEEEF